MPKSVTNAFVLVDGVRTLRFWCTDESCADAPRVDLEAQIRPGYCRTTEELAQKAKEDDALDRLYVEHERCIRKVGV